MLVGKQFLNSIVGLSVIKYDLAEASNVDSNRTGSIVRRV